MNFEKMRANAERRSTFENSAMPAPLAAATADDVTELDVREDLRNGVEPFSRIMTAQAGIPAGGVLQVRAIFEPVPLYMVLGRQGFTHWTERLADDDWRVWFYRGDLQVTDSTATPVATSSSQPPAPEENLVILDVRGLEPPEPMTRTLEALQELPAGKSLLQVNARVPQFLLPLLAERGFEYVLVSEQPNEVRGLIQRITTKK